MRSRPQQSSVLPQSLQARHPDCHRHTLLACAAALVMAGSAVPVAAAAAVSDGPAVQRASEDRAYAIVQLAGEPLSTAAATRPAKGKKIDFNNSGVKAYRAQLSALRNDFRQWLRANLPGARVTGEFDLALNAVGVELNGATLAQLAAAPRVVRASYQGLYYKLQAAPGTDPDLGIIRAIEAWGPARPTTAGEGVRVAIIDSGIDLNHPCFDPRTYAAQQQIGDPRFTSNKVIAAKVFNNRTGRGSFTPEAIDAHGTHVSGTVACNANTPAKVDGVTIPYNISGVAPRALLGNYNVFPGTVANARSEDIFNAMEAAYQDGFDVANMSLGGGTKGIQDLEMQAINNLDEANMVFAVAAGNSGTDGAGSVESPGAAARALTAGASAVGHGLTTFLKTDNATYTAVRGEFGTVPAAGLTASLAVLAQSGTTLGLSEACNTLTPGSLSGKVAVLSRGTCFFYVKVRNAQQAGAVAAIVVNNRAGEPIVMAGATDPALQPTIPAFMVANTDAASLVANDTRPITLPTLATYVRTPAFDDTLADFSSQGPTAVDARIKPDVMAPGVNVLSSIPATACAAPPCFAFFNGTSMATPHLAGSAAVLRGQHPTWSAADVRSAIVNTAVRGVVKKPDGSIITAVNTVGAGREDLVSASGAAVAVDPVSVSFGPIPQGSGQTRSVRVTLHNISGAVKTYSLKALNSNAGDTSVAFAVDTTSVTVLPDATASVQVLMTAQKGAALGGHEGVLEITTGSASVAHAALYMLVK